MPYSPAARALIESNALAHMVTLGRDGRPQISCVWVGFDDDDPETIVFSSLGDYQKIKNLRRDPRVALSIETSDGPNEYGLIPYLVINGTARITEGGGPEVLQRLAHTYLGPDVVFPPMDDPPPGYVVHITADKVGGVGDWTVD